MIYKSEILIYLLTAIAFITTGSALNSEDEPSPQELLELLRNPPVLESWARMKGTIKHKSKGMSSKNLKIEVRAHLNSEGIVSQLLFNDSERYLIEQKFGNNQSENKVICQKKEKESQTTLSDVGLRPSDITLSFLYWDFEEELPRDQVRGQACRVLRLTDPENIGEFIHLWVSIKFIFPLKVQWFHFGSAEPFRTLEFTGFKKLNDVWIIKELKLSGPQWKSLVKMRDNQVEQITAAKPIPEDLFEKE